jgi:hypothetical protein
LCWLFQLLGITDPLVPLENLFKKIFLGGIFDTLQETFYGKPEEEASESAGQSKTGLPNGTYIYLHTKNYYFGTFW